MEEGINDSVEQISDVDHESPPQSPSFLHIETYEPVSSPPVLPSSISMSNTPDESALYGQKPVVNAM